MNINNFSPQSSRMLKEDGNTVNIADLLEQIANNGGTLGGNPISETNPMPITSTDEEYGHIVVTIAQGASQSGVIDLEGYQLATLHMPATWDAADISFLSAPTADGTFQPVYADGIEVTEPVAAGRCCPVSANAVALASLRFIKLRSGVAGVEVAQTAARTITLSLKG